MLSLEAERVTLNNFEYGWNNFQICKCVFHVTDRDKNFCIFRKWPSAFTVNVTSTPFYLHYTSHIVSKEALYVCLYLNRRSELLITMLNEKHTSNKAKSIHIHSCIYWENTPLTWFIALKLLVTLS